MTTLIEAARQALEALEKLWDIIDDIDTYGDMAKSDDKLYRSLVERRQRQRFEQTGISTDGYELNGGAITTLRQAIEQAEKQGQWGASSVTKPEYVAEQKEKTQRALDLMAENARELGLDYEPVAKLKTADEPCNQVMALGQMMQQWLTHQIADAGTSVDVGKGFSEFDLWVQCEGKKLYINIKEKRPTK